MDYKKDLIELVEKYCQLSEALEDAKKRWQQADSGSTEEDVADRDRRFLTSQLSTLRDDIMYLKRKVFTPEDWGSMGNYIQFGGTLINLNFQNLQSVANEFSYSYRSFSEQNRVVFIFDKEEDDDGLPLQVAVNFVLDDIFLRSYACPTGCEVKDEVLKEKIIKELNIFNEQTRIMKAYIDNEGSVCLERQDIIDYGCTKEAIYKIMEFVIRSVADFYKNRSETYLDYLRTL